MSDSLTILTRGACCSASMRRVRSENQMHNREGSQQGGNLWKSLGLSMHVMTRTSSGSRHGSVHGGSMHRQGHASVS